MDSIALLPSCYLAPLNYYAKLKNYEKCCIEHYEHFEKQTYRNRCVIDSPNGPLNLSVPIVRRNQRQIAKDVKISYDYDWQKLHWRSLESSYRRSAFFEFYEDDLRPFYEEKKYQFVVDLNENIQQQVLLLLKLKANYSFTSTYTAKPENTKDYRSILSPKEPLTADTEFVIQPYFQVFETRHGFIPNLSIVDILFNYGPKSSMFF